MFTSDRVINANNWQAIEAIQMRIYHMSGDTSLTHYFSHSLRFHFLYYTATNERRAVYTSLPRGVKIMQAQQITC